MDQNDLYIPPPIIGQNENDFLVTCPYCNQTMKEDILNDHLLGHELENEDNLNSKNDLNNQNYNSSHLGPVRRENSNPSSEPMYYNNNRPNIQPNNLNNQNGNFLSNLFSSIFNPPSDNQNNNSSQINNNNNNNNNNSNNNNNDENNPGFFNSLFGRNPYRNNNEPQNNNNNNNNSNNNNYQADEGNLFKELSNTIGQIGRNLSSTLLNNVRSNGLIRTSLLDNNPLRIMRINQQPINNRHYDYSSQILVPDSSINNQVIIMRPVIVGPPGYVYDPNNPNNNNNLSDEDLNRIMGYLPSSVVNENKEGENNNCVICLGDFEIGESVTTLPCLHRFHTECIKTWLKSNNHCPVCKFEISLNSIMREN